MNFLTQMRKELSGKKESHLPSWQTWNKGAKWKSKTQLQLKTIHFNFPLTKIQVQLKQVLVQLLLHPGLRLRVQLHLWVKLLFRLSFPRILCMINIHFHLFLLVLLLMMNDAVSYARVPLPPDSTTGGLDLIESGNRRVDPAKVAAAASWEATKSVETSAVSAGRKG